MVRRVARLPVSPDEHGWQDDGGRNDPSMLTIVSKWMSDILGQDSQQPELAKISGGVWGDNWSIRAYALAENVDIIVVAPNKVQLYSARPDYALPHKGKQDLVQSRAPYVAFPHAYGGADYDLPAEAVSNDRLFLMYDGCAHYWSAYRQHDVDGTADPSWLSAAKSGLSLYKPCYLDDLDGNEAAAPCCSCMVLLHNISKGTSVPRSHSQMTHHH
ncbi:hypothetical protein WJX77_011633 [Trebouxia sp. C0004]